MRANGGDRVVINGHRIGVPDRVRDVPEGTIRWGTAVRRARQVGRRPRRTCAAGGRRVLAQRDIADPAAQ